MEDREFENELATFDLLGAPGHLLRRNHQRSYEIFSAVVGEDVTRQQIAVLVTLAKNPGASQTSLVELTGIDKSTMREMLGRLVSRGWIERERDSNDSRAWKMHLAAQGEDVLRERLPLVRKAQNEIIAPLSAEDRKTFLRLLRKLLALEAG